MKNVDVNYEHLCTNDKSGNSNLGSFNSYISLLSNAVINQDAEKVDLIIQHSLFDELVESCLCLYKEI